LRGSARSRDFGGGFFQLLGGKVKIVGGLVALVIPCDPWRIGVQEGNEQQHAPDLPKRGPRRNSPQRIAIAGRVISPPFQLREFRSGDDVAAHIRSIYEEFQLVFDLEFEDDLQDVGESYASGKFWLVEDEAGIVATAAVLPHGAARIVKRIYVAPRGRRAGLARELLRETMRWGDFVRTELWSDVRFRSAHRLYLSEGMKPGPTRVLADPDASVERYFFLDHRR
jgi:GNAT superfamily N-acetyltransferase